MTATGRDVPRAVVVGTVFGCSTHVPALRAAGFEVVALVGRDPGRTTELASRLGIPLGTVSLSEALDAARPDLVTIATPVETHAPLVRTVVDAGVDVLCEKPFAESAAQARDLLERARAAGVRHYLGTEFRYATAQALMARAVADGVIGTPRLATLLFFIAARLGPSAGPTPDGPAGPVPDRPAGPAPRPGFLLAQAPHLVDRVESMLGPIAGVSGGTSPAGRSPGEPETGYTVHFRTRSGVDGVMQASAAVWGPASRAVRVAGDEGTLWEEAGEVRLADAAGNRVLVPPQVLREERIDLDLRSYPGYANGLGEAIEIVPFVRLLETVRALRRDEPPPYGIAPASFEDGVRAMEVLEAVATSDRERRWVPVAPTG